MSFPYPRILDRVTNSDWVITQGALRSILTALENASVHGVTENVALTASKGTGGNVILRDGNIGVVSISGIIGKRLSSMDTMCGGVDVNAITRDVQSLIDDPGISKVVMDWDSPGGTITGIPEAYDALVKMGRKKTLVSYTETMQCSGAEYLASAATSKYAAASATVANIGVYNLILDRTEQLANDGIKVNAISAGKNKLMGASFQPLSDEHRAMLQDRVDAIYKDFKSAVTRGRKVDQSAMDGQAMTGAEGVTAGLIDGIYPSLESLISALQKMGGQ